MKISHLSPHTVTRTVRSSLNRRKSFFNNKFVPGIKKDGKKLFTAFLFMSSSLHPHDASKLMAVPTRVLAINGDVFEHSVKSPVIKDCFTAKKHVVKKTMSKSPLLKSAKNVMLMGSSSKPIKELDISFNKLLLKKNHLNNPLTNKAEIFVQKAENFGVNPVVLMAIAMTESARGTSKAAILKNNVGGIMGKTSLRKFHNVDECIEKMAQTISHHHKKSQLHSVADLGYSGKYCDKSAAEEWIKNVMFYVKKLS